MNVFGAASDSNSPPTDSADAGQSSQDVAWRVVLATVLAVILAVVVFDQVTKYLIVEALGHHQTRSRIEFGGSWFALEYVENTGAAFGMLKGRTWLLSILALLVATCFVAMFWKQLPHDGWLRTSVALVAGGAIGNLADRVRLGYVVDFVAVGTWPRFNVADTAITIGLVLLAWTVLRYEGQRVIEET